MVRAAIMRVGRRMGPGNDGAGVMGWTTLHSTSCWRRRVQAQNRHDHLMRYKLVNGIQWTRETGFFCWPRLLWRESSLFPGALLIPDPTMPCHGNT